MGTAKTIDVDAIKPGVGRFRELSLADPHLMHLLPFFSREAAHCCEGW
ncbi:MAG: hypothetical protein QXK88_11595 [Desulfurococcaceae archaeon]